MSAQAGVQDAGCGYFLADFFALIFLPPFAFDATAPAIRKSSGFLPDLIAAVSQRGFNPRPAQASLGFEPSSGSDTPIVDRALDALGLLAWRMAVNRHWWIVGAEAERIFQRRGWSRAIVAVVIPCLPDSSTLYTWRHMAHVS